MGHAPFLRAREIRLANLDQKGSPEGANPLAGVWGQSPQSSQSCALFWFMFALFLISPFGKKPLPKAIAHVSPVEYILGFFAACTLSDFADQLLASFVDSLA